MLHSHPQRGRRLVVAVTPANSLVRFGESSSRKEIGQLPGGNETVLYVEDEITVRSLTA